MFTTAHHVSNPTSTPSDPFYKQTRKMKSFHHILDLILLKISSWHRLGEVSGNIDCLLNSQPPPSNSSKGKYTLEGSIKWGDIFDRKAGNMKWFDRMQVANMWSVKHEDHEVSNPSVLRMCFLCDQSNEPFFKRVFVGVSEVHSWNTQQSVGSMKPWNHVERKLFQHSCWITCQQFWPMFKANTSPVG